MSHSIERIALGLILLLAAALAPGCGGPPAKTGEPTDGRPASLHVQPPALSFVGSVGGTNPPIQTLTISNQGGGHLTWSVKVSPDASWLRVSRNMPRSETNGVEGPGRSSSPPLDVSTNMEGLAPGVYNGTIEVTWNGGSAAVGVSLTVRSSSRD